MTLLVGAVFPGEELLGPEIPRALRLLSTQTGVIIAADSRWTFPSGRTEDGAVKVFGVQANGLGAYAGSAAAGEDVIIALSTDALPAESIPEFASGIQGRISRIWQAHQPNDDGLEILFGYSYASGHAWQRWRQNPLRSDDVRQATGHWSYEDRARGRGIHR